MIKKQQSGFARTQNIVCIIKSGLLCAHAQIGLQGTFKAGFPLGGILRAERNFSLSCDFSGGTN
jgi:hypothetical protein